MADFGNKIAICNFFTAKDSDGYIPADCFLQGVPNGIALY
jgi:hypothetical protein